MNAIVLPSTEQDRKIVEECLPGAMFELLFVSLIERGDDVRQDLKELAGKCSVAPMIQTPPLDPFTVRRLADRVQKDGYDILKDAGTDSVEVLVGGLSRCLVRMVNEGIPVNQDAVIIALGICAEMDDDVEDWGKKNVVDRVAGRIEKNFTDKGYMYKHMVLAEKPIA